MYAESLETGDCIVTRASENQLFGIASLPINAVVFQLVGAAVLCKARPEHGPQSKPAGGPPRACT